MSVVVIRSSIICPDEDPMCTRNSLPLEVCDIHHPRLVNHIPLAYPTQSEPLIFSILHNEIRSGPGECGKKESYFSRTPPDNALPKSMRWRYCPAASESVGARSEAGV